MFGGTGFVDLRVETNLIVYGHVLLDDVAGLGKDQCSILTAIACMNTFIYCLHIRT